MKLWGGRFKKETHPEAEKFLSSISFDQRLYAEDIEGSIAHAKMLAFAGIVSEQEKDSIVKGLEEIKEEIEKGKIRFSDEEDIHLAIEEHLTQKIGETAGKLHTARSRNDQVALDTRLFLRREIKEILKLLGSLQETILEKASKNIEVIMPGFTHLQHAQPILFSHHILAYFYMLERDKKRLEGCLERVNILPLGAGAIAGSSLPIDREYLARLLDFPKVSANSVDAVSDRDFMVEFISGAAMIAMHLSRFSEEIILWSTSEFGFISIGEEFCTGSSLMPQKKNPDVAEVVRGKTGRIYGDLINILVLLKGLPLAYNRDMQDDKISLFDSVDNIKETLSVFSEMLKTIEVKKEKMLAEAGRGYPIAADLAEYLVKKDIPFREAHISVGKLVQFAEEKEKTLEELTLDELKAFCYKFEADVYEAMKLKASVDSKKSFGGTATENVKKAIEEARKLIG
ncbi:MAG: argininosuccinate lyase [Candidatus Ratteibacteria bacterium]|nr:argininosuccinate lyase [Candidatus Ratteibacteria bacterium]